MINCSCLILSCWCLIWIVEDILAWRLGWRLESSGETPPPPAVHPNTIVNSDYVSCPKVSVANGFPLWTTYPMPWEVDCSVCKPHKWQQTRASVCPKVSVANGCPLRPTDPMLWEVDYPVCKLHCSIKWLRTMEFIWRHRIFHLNTGTGRYPQKLDTQVIAMFSDMLLLTRYTPHSDR